MHDRTHWQFCGVIDLSTLQIVEVGAFIGPYVGVQHKDSRYGEKLIVLIAEVKTRNITESAIALRALVEAKHPWVAEKFPDALDEIHNPNP
jgi:hypothetical protein